MHSYRENYPCKVVSHCRPCKGEETPLRPFKEWELIEQELNPSYLRMVLKAAVIHSGCKVGGGKRGGFASGQRNGFNQLPLGVVDL